MIDHVSLSVSNLAKSKAFYAKALQPLGYRMVSESSESFGVGEEGGSQLYVSQGTPQKPIAHLAFRAQTRAAVDAFHAEALAAGARDHGGPGVRETYAPNYYAAFVLDPDGNNVEAVCYKK